MIMSLDQKKLIRKNKIEKITILSIQIFIVIAFFITWELLTKYKIINAFIYSSPSRIFLTLKDLVSANDLLPHILTTCYETFIAFILGISLGFIIAIILYSFKILYKIKIRIETNNDV